jgi:magnesium transporter
MNNDITTTLSPTAMLEDIWIRVDAENKAEIARIAAKYKVEFPASAEGVFEDHDSVCLNITHMMPEAQDFRRETIVIAFSDKVVVTLEPKGHFAPFDKALARFKRHPGLVQSSYSIMRTLLQAMNDAAAETIDMISQALETMNDQIGVITSGLDSSGREIGVSDINGTMIELNEKEELISRCLECQLSLARAARYLRMEINGSDHELKNMVETLLSDMDGVKQHASFEHEKVRYLQQSVMTSLNVKQNQIVKVFTIITAVFLPPTLVATFYGMNFAVMPELTWKHGFTATIIQTLLAALLPLLYIKKKGWLR